jgi:hypothetical protein
MATIKECDRCGKQSKNVFDTVHVSASIFIEHESDHEILEKDLCISCKKALIDFFKPLPSQG